MAADLQNNPLTNRRPSDSSFANGIRHVLDLHALRSEKMVPAKVVSYDRKSNTATVQPMLMLVDMNDDTRSRNQISELPVFSLGGGGFHINFPLKAGDLGWMIAADRDISLFMKNLEEARPTTFRTHKFSDAWFIPDVFRKYTINSEDDSAMVIQSTDGETRISIDNGKITITAPESVKIDTPMATFTHDVHIQGNLRVDMMMSTYGGFNAAVGGNTECTLPQSTTIGGIYVYGHGHVQTAVAGQRTSDGMIS
jgi:hypothetical protein